MRDGGGEDGGEGRLALPPLPGGALVGGVEGAEEGEEGAELPPAGDSARKSASTAAAREKEAGQVVAVSEEVEGPPGGERAAGGAQRASAC